MLEKVREIIADKLSVNEADITMESSFCWWFKRWFIRFSRAYDGFRRWIKYRNSWWRAEGFKTVEM